LQLYIGCSGWSYSAWEGHFYPKGRESKKYLKYYSKVFDFVEIDSSFYQMPDPFSIRRWSSDVPENFKFAVKFPRVITHNKRLIDIEKTVSRFYSIMLPLEPMSLSFLIQLPPSFGAKEDGAVNEDDFENLRSFISKLDHKYRYAIEFRNKSWFNDRDADNTYELLKKNNICLVCNQLDDNNVITPPVGTTDFVYLRLIGDRSIDEKDFGRLQKDRTSEMQKWANELQRLNEKENKCGVKFAIMAANNHYAGFGPATANMFRRLVGLPEAKWEEKKQSTLSDFGSL